MHVLFTLLMNSWQSPPGATSADYQRELQGTGLSRPHSGIDADNQMFIIVYSP